MLPIKVKDQGGYRGFMFVLNNAWYHLGHDFNISENTEVFAVDDGMVLFCGQMDGFGGTRPEKKGGCLIIQHQGYICVYGHLKEMSNKKEIKKGEFVGKIAPYFIEQNRFDHLHFAKHLGNGIPTANHNGKIEQVYLGYETKNNIGGWVDPLK